MSTTSIVATSAPHTATTRRRAPSSSMGWVFAFIRGFSPALSFLRRPTPGVRRERGRWDGRERVWKEKRRRGEAVVDRERRRADGARGARKLNNYHRSAAPAPPRLCRGRLRRSTSQSVSQYFDPPMPATIHSRTMRQAPAFALGLVRPLAYAFDISHAASYHREQNETRTTTATPDRETCERNGRGEDDQEHKRGKDKGWLHDEREWMEVHCFLLRFFSEGFSNWRRGRASQVEDGDAALVKHPILRWCYPLCGRGGKESQLRKL
ncbi:hypothetical protein B0H13DRAFT_1019609 [Mycena leptocephala]|nr:hypothetical protein B0H13DRAFT_1019609 [Mycena leptocephala]